MMAASGNHKDSDNGHDVVDHCVNIVPRTTSAVQSQIAASSKQLADTLTRRTAKRSLALLHQQQTNGGKSNKPVAPVEAPQTAEPAAMPKTTASATVGTARRKSSFPTLEKLPLFQQFRKRGGSAPAIHSITPPSKDARPTFVKSSSIARLFGNTYSTAAKEAASTADTSANGQTVTAKASASTKASQSPSTITAERFHACTNDADQQQLLNDEHCVTAAAATDAASVAVSAHLYGDDFDVALNPFRSLSRGLGRLFFKKSYSVKISEPDPEFKVAYLGNVLTGWAKGE